MALVRKTILIALLGATLIGYFVYGQGNRSLPETSSTAQEERLAEFRSSLKPIKVPSSLEYLPNLRGQGYLRDLREAAVIDKRLRSLMKRYISEPDSARRTDLTLPILDAWISTSKRTSSLADSLKQAEGARPIVLRINGAEGERVANLMHKVHSLEVVTGSRFFTFKDFREDAGTEQGVVSLMSGAVPKTLMVASQEGQYVLQMSDLNLRPKQTQYVENAYVALVKSLERALLIGRYQYCLEHPLAGFERMNAEKLCRIERTLGEKASPWSEGAPRTSTVDSNASAARSNP
jgi:hypothetical protein